MSFSSSPKRIPLSLQSLLKRGLTPTLDSINDFLRFLSLSQRFKLISHLLFPQLASNQITGNSQTHSTVAWALLKLCRFDEAEGFLRNHFAVETPNPHANRLWDSLLRSRCKDDPEKALLVLRHSLKSNGGIVFPSSRSVRSLIRGFASKGDIGKAIEVLELITEFDYPFAGFVCSSVMAGVFQTGKDELAVKLFADAVVSGAVKPNLVTYVVLVGGLCRLKQVSKVRELVCRMLKDGIEPDVIFRCCWICGYVSEGLLSEVSKRNMEMVGDGIVDEFLGLRESENSVVFLERMWNLGLERNSITFGAFVLVFCRKRKLREAFSVFDMSMDLGDEVEDEFMYATLIDGLCSIGEFDWVAKMLVDMEKRWISPSLVTINTLINGLCKFGRTAMEDEVSMALSRDPITYEALLNGYIKEDNFTGILETKRRIEDSGVKVDAVMYNVLIKALFMVGEIDEACALYEGICDQGVVVSAGTFFTMIDGFCKVGRVDQALEVFDEFKRSGINSVACYHCLFSGLCNSKLVDLAVEVFLELYDEGFHLDVVICRVLIESIIEQKGPENIARLLYILENIKLGVYRTLCGAAIDLLCKKSYPEAAFQVLTLMRTKGLTLSSNSYYQAIIDLIAGGYEGPSCSNLNSFLKDYGLDEPRVSQTIAYYMCMMNDVESTLLFLKKMERSYGTIKLPRSLFEELIKRGRVLDAYKLSFKAKRYLPKMDIVDYTNIIHVLCKKGYTTKALDIARFAQRSGIHLDIATYTSIIGGLCSQGRIVEAFRVFNSLERLNLIPDKITYAVLLFALCREGHLVDAKLLLERMTRNGLEPNIRMYNSLIDCYCRTGKMEGAQTLLNELEVKGLKPDGFTVSSMINGCCYSGNMERALEYYFKFRRKGVLPDFLGFKYLTSGLSSKGRLEEARTIIRDMLQCPSVVEFINKVNTEGETETISQYLNLSCDQGHIKEAVSVLDEVASIYFPRWKAGSCIVGLEERNESPSGLLGSQGEKIAKGHGYSVKDSKRYDFGTYYLRIASLCSKGELQKANELATELLPKSN